LGTRDLRQGLVAVMSIIHPVLLSGLPGSGDKPYINHFPPVAIYNPRSYKMDKP
jgi:hypothetical protein